MSGMKVASGLFSADLGEALFLGSRPVVLGQCGSASRLSMDPALSFAPVSVGKVPVRCLKHGEKSRIAPAVFTVCIMGSKDASQEGSAAPGYCSLTDSSYVSS